jgi:UDP-N-acetylmuramyl tripeptide synthase
VDTVAERWRASLKRLPATSVLALNADDPAVAALADDFAGKVIYFGVETTPTHDNADELTQVVDTRTCPRCRAVLTFAPRFYSHIGHWSCPTCGFARPVPQISAQVGAADIDGARLTLTTPNGSGAVTISLPGLYNVYNALAAATAGYAVGMEFAAIAEGLAQFTPAFGRAETIPANGRFIRILLTKNPTGLNEALRALVGDHTGPRKHLLMLLNDRAADGEDVSWIWDADFEQLAGTTATLSASGVRAYDLALRLKYAGEPPQFVEPDIAAALEQALVATPAGETLYIVPTYTAMLAVRGEIEKRGFVAKYWEQPDE